MPIQGPLTKAETEILAGGFLKSREPNRPSGIVVVHYSRGQAKPTNKNGNSLMAEKVTGKHADMLREASGKISAKSHEPLRRKCPYTEIVPKILTAIPKSAEKNMENSAIASFH